MASGVVYVKSDALAGNVTPAMRSPPIVEEERATGIREGATIGDVELCILAAHNLSIMIAEIMARKIGTKWHGTIEGRPDIDETALTEEAVRRKMEQLRDGLGICGAATDLFGGRTCELIAGHRKIGELRQEHRSGSVVWFDVDPDDPRERKMLRRERGKLTRAA